MKHYSILPFMFTYICICLWDFPGSSVVKNLPAMQEMHQMWVRSPCWKDPLEEELQRVGHTEQLSMHAHKYLHKHQKDVERNTPKRYTDFLHHVEIIMQGVNYE